MMQCLFLCLLDELILGFCYSNLTRETGGFKIEWTITLVLQANRLSMCVSHPKQDSSKSSLHRAIILSRSVRFILFFHILPIFLFVSKLKKGQVGIFDLCVTAFISYIPRNHTAVCF